MLTLVLLAALQPDGRERRERSGRRNVRIAVLVCFLAAQLYYMALGSGTLKAGGGGHRGIDFTAYYLAAKMAASGTRHDLYVLPLYADGRMNLATEAVAGSSWQATARQYGLPFAMPFLYPPVVALLFLPLAWFSFAAAHTLWLTLSLGFYLFGAVMALRVSGIGVSKPMLLPAGVGLLSFFPLLDQMFCGQVDALIFCLLAGCLLLFTRNRLIGSSLCFALAALIKLTPFLLVPVFVVHRKWRWLGMCFGWTAIMFGLSMLRSGWEAQWEFATRVLPHLGSGSPTVANASLSAWIQEVMAGQVYTWATAPEHLPLHASALSRGVILVVCGFVLARMYRLRRERDLMSDLMAAILLMLLVSPISWWHHYVMALLPILYFARQREAATAWAALGLLLLVGTNAAGWGATVATQPSLRLAFAAVVPGLLLALLGIELLGRPAPAASSNTAAKLKLVAASG